MNEILQFAIDVEGRYTESQIKDALESAGIYVLGVAWKATWDDDGYHSGKPPVSSD